MQYKSNQSMSLYRVQSGLQHLQDGLCLLSKSKDHTEPSGAVSARDASHETNARPLVSIYEGFQCCLHRLASILC